MWKKIAGQLFIISSLLIFADTRVMATDEQYLIINKKEGGEISYVLSKDMKISYNGDTLIMNAKDVTVEYPVYDIAQIYFKTIPTGISNNGLDNNEVITATNNEVVFKGFETSLPVYIYSLSGILIKEYKIDKDGELSISLRGQSQGFYIIRAGLSILKISHR
jgi:hypothetical protein